MPEDDAKATAPSTDALEARIDHVKERLDRIRLRLEIVERGLSNNETKLIHLSAKMSMIAWLLGGVGIVALLLLIRSFWSV